jgi:hypothetical protein
MPSDRDDITVFVDDDETFDTDIAMRIMLMRGEKIHTFSDKRHFTAKELQEFCVRDSAACKKFAEKCLVWYGMPIIMQDYQCRMVDGWLEKPRTCYPMGRGIGKDFTLAIFLAWYCTCFPNTRVMIVCPATRQVKTFIDENLAIMLQTSSVLYDSIAKKIDEEMHFTNGSIIFSYGATSFIKGKHNINMIFCNEASEIPEHVYENVLMPMLGVGKSTRGLFGVMGVPGGQRGYFWSKFSTGTEDFHEETDQFFVMNLPTSYNEHYSKDQLEINRLTMSEDAYLQEHEAKFLDLEGALFSQKLINQMKEDYEVYYGIINPKRFDYYIAIDWGRINDYSVVSIVSRERSTKQLRLDFIKAMRDPFPIQEAWIDETIKIYNPKMVIPEYMGIGIPPSDRLKANWGTRVKLFVPTPANWFDVFTRMRDFAVQGDLIIPAGELKLIRQLRLLTFQIRNNRLTVRSEGKDDFAQSVGMAFYAIAKGSGAGVAGSI